MNLKQFLILALFGALLGGIAAGIFEWRQQTDENPLNEQGIATYVPDFSLRDLEGHVWRAEEWKSKILVINFWASWCPPCRKETPMLVKLAEEFRKHNVLFVGIAIDDKEPVQNFADTYGIEYPILVTDLKGIELSNQMGNRFSALPFTLVADENNKIIYRQAGEIGESTLRSLLDQLSRP